MNIIPDFFRILFSTMTMILFSAYRLFSALSGAIIYPAAVFFQLYVNYIVLSVIMLFTILATSVSVAKYAYNFGVLASLGSFATMSSSLTAMAIVFLPVSYLIVTSISMINAVVKGFYLGLNGGLGAVFTSINVRPSQLTDLILGDNEVERARRLSGSFQYIMSTLGLNNYVNVNSSASFESLRLTPVEIAELRNGHRPLTTAEIAQLRALNDIETTRLVTRYDNIHTKLTDPETEDPILAERPERQNAILLVKQYNVNNQWVPVPGVIDLYNDVALYNWFIRNNSPTHPQNRDKLTQPGPMVMDGTGRETRYRFHPYYLSDTDEPFSQELNMLSASLVQKLNLIPAHLNPVQLSQVDLDVEGSRPLSFV